ncbi:SMC5-SMC6 complex localization factor protein 2 isoform X2 [Cheilinus undulatus]|nr:SMC5-SMC6 complex localization factor protein 2 isoform X2 [Cheilinus undulatus]XP_041646053.1 SMC5-SMC6 complex localization factor protein 2 isoform X2 [Cheilinus undulatus]
MKPSQVPNRLPHLAPRRILPLPKPELYPASPCPEQRHKRMPSREKLSPAADMNCSSLKRRREFEDCDGSPVKLHRQREICKAQTPKTTSNNCLRTSLVSSSSSRQSLVLEQSPESTDNHLCGQSACSSSLKSAQASCVSSSPLPCKQRQSPMGAKQAYIKHTQNHTLRILDLKSPTKQGAENSKKRGEEDHKTDKSSSSFSPGAIQKDVGNLPSFSSGSHHSGHRSASVLTVKTPRRGNSAMENRKSASFTPKSAVDPNSDSLSGSTVKRSKTSHTRRPVADDIDDLFTPDPLKYIVSPANKASKTKTDGVVVKSSTPEKSSPNTATTSSTTVSQSVCQKTQKVTTGSPHTGNINVAPSSNKDPDHSQLSVPFVTLKRVKIENPKPSRCKDPELKNGHIPSSSRQLKEETVKSNDKQNCNHPNDVNTSTLETAASGQFSTHPPLLQRQASRELKQEVKNVDPVDVELDLDLSLALDLDLTQSSHSSEDEQLLSLQEMMERATKPPDTPEKGAFSEPGTPGPLSCKLKKQPLPAYTKTCNYKNSLDQMLKEINTNKRSKEVETQLLTACKEDLLRIAEYEETEENQDEGISTEHQEFLQRYSLISSAIREVPPGELVFSLEKFGQIFNHNTLQLRQCMITPEGAAQKTLLWSSPAHLRLNVNSGLFLEVYACHSPCPTQVTRFLFKMMSVHNERVVSENILQTLYGIATTAAYQIVKNKSQKFQVWVPSLADITLVLLNMGASFVTLFPFENLQPPFTEGDLLGDAHVKAESSSTREEQCSFPEHNCINILKYLSYCLDLCPKAYSDDELLLLLTVVGKVGLDTQLILQSASELYPLQYKIVNNFRDWNTMLPRICLALTDLTDDHHNMCALVTMLSDNTRGKQLRRHLSLCMISKLLDGNCTYRPTEEEIQLSELRRFLPRMQPSTLLRSMLRNQRDKEDMETLDQQSYYLCYSLLTLVNEASNFQFFPAHQKEQLLILCSELEMHVKCDIRESEKRLYRSKVKDLVARIDTKWQILLRKTRPLNGKLYDFWQPSSEYTLTNSQEGQEGNSSDEREEDEEAETNEAKDIEAEVVSDDTENEGEETIHVPNKTVDLGKEEVPQTEAQVHSESEVTVEDKKGENKGSTEVQNENDCKAAESPLHDQAEAGDLVS